MTRDYDAEAKDHPKHKYAYDFDYQMHRYLMHSFSESFTAGRALELGCYHGHFTRLLCDSFPSVDVVDASAECIDEARRVVDGKARFFERRFENFVPDCEYDNIFLVHTLEHLDQRVEMLQRIRGWLSDGGRLFVATPNARAGSRQIAVKMGLIAHNTAVTDAERAHGHRVTYSLDTLCADIVAAGLHAHRYGGVFFKGLANFQLDAALQAGIISQAYLDGCYDLGQSYPDLCSSIYYICGKVPA
jgi:2-polyprenyl-3-methyl-5-hydroxy-6-metoxy-1,4-benzoquinol methylase